MLEEFRRRKQHKDYYEEMSKRHVKEKTKLGYKGEAVEEDDIV